MKRISISLLAVAVLGSLFSCQKDDGTVTLSATTRNYNAPKTTVSDQVVNWSNGDHVKINGKSFQVNVQSNTASIINVPVNNTGYAAVFPADIVTGTFTASSTSVAVELPRVQQYRKDNTGAQVLANPMMAYTQGSALMFNNVCSLFKVTVTNPDPNNYFCLKDITVASSSAPLSGAGTISISGQSLSLTGSTAADRQVTLSFLQTEDSIAVGASRTYYVVLPAFASSDLTVTIHGNTIHKNYTWSKSSASKSLAADYVVDGPTANSSYADCRLLGAGTEQNKYLVQNYNDLCIMANHMAEMNSSHRYYSVTNDINCGSRPYKPINNFNGDFNGNYHTITYNITASNTPLANIGLLGTTSNGSLVKYLRVSGSINVTGPQDDCYVGGICGTLNGECSNCKSSMTINVSSAYQNLSLLVGGICGESNGPTTIGARNDTNLGNITVTMNYALNNKSLCVGGILGRGKPYVCINNGNIVTNLYGTSTLNEFSGMGGIVGSTSSLIHRCDNYGSVTVSDLWSHQDDAFYVGGIAGSWHPMDQIALADDCLNHGDVSAFRAGGLIGNISPSGYNESTNIQNCVNDLTGWHNHAGLVYNVSGSVRLMYCYVSSLSYHPKSSLIYWGGSSSSADECYYPYGDFCRYYGTRDYNHTHGDEEEESDCRIGIYSCGILSSNLVNCHTMEGSRNSNYGPNNWPTRAVLNNIDGNPGEHRW